MLTVKSTAIILDFMAHVGSGSRYVPLLNGLSSSSGN